MNCSRCNNPVSPGQNFCSSCGAPIIVKDEPKQPNRAVSLIISRRTSFVGMAMPVKILINGMAVGQIKVGGKLELSIPPQDCTLELDMVGNNMNLRPIRAQYTLTPSRSAKGVVTVDFGIKANTIGVITSGIWQKLGDFNADIKYL